MTTIFQVNDDKDLMGIYSEEIREVLKSDYTERKFEDMLSAVDAEGRCDLLIIDMSALSPMMGIFHPSHCYSLLASWYKKRPHCPVIIATGFGERFVENVMDLVRNICPEATAEHFELGGGVHDRLGTLLRKYLVSLS